MRHPEWISHRGLDRNCTENTRQAFERAIDAGFRHLETDLRTTSDGHIILHHDPDLRRTAGYRARIGDLSMQDCSEVHYEDGQRILTFDNFAEHFGDARWVLDIKPEEGPRTLKALYEWASKNQCGDWLLRNARFLLWSTRDRTLLQQYFPGAEMLANERECRLAGLPILLGMPRMARIVPDKTYSLPPRFLGRELFSPRVTGYYHAKGARLLAYLPESPADLEKALESGADEVLVNGPPLHP